MAMMVAAVVPGAPIEGVTKFPLIGPRSWVYICAVPVAVLVMVVAEVPYATVFKDARAELTQDTVTD